MEGRGLEPKVFIDTLYNFAILFFPDYSSEQASNTIALAIPIC